MRRGTFLSAVIALLWLGVVDSTFACPSCFGDPSSSETQAMKWAILSLLAVTGTVLAGVSAFFIYMRRRTHDINRRFSDRLN